MSDEKIKLKKNSKLDLRFVINNKKERKSPCVQRWRSTSTSQNAPAFVGEFIYFSTNISIDTNFGVNNNYCNKRALYRRFCNVLFQREPDDKTRLR